LNEDQNVQEMNDITAVREVVLSAYPDCVPELVQGDTVAELLASVEPARAVYARVAATVPTPVDAVSTPPPVPAGGSRAVIDPGDLPAAEKVRRGIANHRR
jgi:hypothetical protein